MAKKLIIRTKNGKRTFKTIKEAAKALKVPYMTAYMRMRAGMPPSKAFKQPVREYRRAA